MNRQVKDNTPAEELNDLSHEVIGAAIEVHQEMGPGLLEGVYERCLIEELQTRGIKVEQQVQLPIKYKGKVLGRPLIIDLLVEDSIIVELKSVKELQEIHAAQLLSYLRLSGKRLGLLINFNCLHLRDGLKRIVNNL